MCHNARNILSYCAVLVFFLFNEDCIYRIFDLKDMNDNFFLKMSFSS